MAHKHPVVDGDVHFIINPITRKISPDSPIKNKIMQYDHNSERFTFELPKMVEGHDMTQCNVVQIHYINGASSDVHEVTDVAASSDDAAVTFSWLISKNATMYAAPLSFIIRFACVTDGVVEYDWRTDIFSGISVSANMNNGPAIVEEYSDILEQWKSELSEGGESVELDTTLTAEDKAAQAKAVGDALERLRESIPEAGDVKLNDDGNGNVVIKCAGGSSSGGSMTPSGVSHAMRESLWAIIQKSAFVTPLTASEKDAFKAAWGIDSDTPVTPDDPITPDEPDEIVLVSISAVANNTEYNVGTDAVNLDITVTANYSDGSSQTVTGYSISGEVAEGSNVFVITYGDKSTTITVTGVMYYTMYDGVPIEHVGYTVTNPNGGLAEQEGTGVTIPIAVLNGNSTFYYHIPKLTGTPYVRYWNSEDPSEENVSGNFTGAALRENVRGGNWSYIAPPMALDSAKFAYIVGKNTGDILLAGNGTTYYGHHNISELGYNENTVFVPTGDQDVVKIGKYCFRHNDTDGSTVATETSSVSEYIDVQDKSSLSIYNENPSANIYAQDMWWYSDIDLPISKVITNTIYYKGRKENITVPSGAKYVRISANTASFVCGQLKVKVV